MLTYQTAGESHGKGLLGIVSGLPAGIEVDFKKINEKLVRRQGGYGRGGRMKLEKDRVEFISGVRQGRTTGSPVGLLLKNRDWENWQQTMSPVPNKEQKKKVKVDGDVRLKKVEARVTRPRPGHADLAGALKYNTGDIRDVLERASARETAMRTAIGGLIDCFLVNFKIEVISHVIQVGEIEVENPGISFQKLKEKVLNSPLQCYDSKKEKEMMEYIDQVKEKGDSLGGVIELRTTSLPVGLGSYINWEERLDSRLAGALMSIPAIKGVEIGPAFANAGKKGSEVHDEIYYGQKKGFYRKTNRAGGLEGGITNGQPLIIRVAMKPLPTLYQPLHSVDLYTKEEVEAGVERSDVIALPAAGVVAEAMVSFVLARAILDKFGGDNLKDIMQNYRHYLKRIDQGGF